MQDNREREMAEDEKPGFKFNNIGHMTLLELCQATDTSYWLNLFEDGYWSLSCFKRGLVQELFWHKEELIGFDSLLNDHPQAHFRDDFLQSNPYLTNVRHRIPSMTSRYLNEFRHSKATKTVVTSTKPQYLYSKLIDLPQTYYDS
jgi:hypothetical protein